MIPQRAMQAFGADHPSTARQHQRHRVGQREKFQLQNVRVFPYNLGIS
ncbi:MAG: hypothetical protein OZSIB_3708 [Candidatus Ozemobacter sibiricus]|uniref:Uncharacterized protein n=1 Tax=Candidatus Ozemobacter sibiricus TaxID=2268124 RepID=A0A367ZD02_9BACT|nr:MAG: hypothetical protein OZSIB_3708 [Candidatus Ozemobacter sibiricus]